VYKKQMMQICPTCGGTGVNKDKPLTMKQGDEDVPVLAPVYTKGEQPRQQYELCKTCAEGSGASKYGSGRVLVDSPTKVLIEGEAVELDDAERRQRFNDTLAVGA
jgi:hypothetical protein